MSDLGTLEDVAVVRRGGGYEPAEYLLLNVIDAQEMPDWEIVIPKKYVEVIIDPAEESEDRVVIRLRRMLDPALAEWRASRALAQPERKPHA